MEAREIWRSVPSVERVLASSHGRVMIVPFFSDKGRGLQQYGGHPSTGSWDGKRYIWRALERNHKVARLICEAFNGPAPPDRPVCMHLDENARNNHPSNLAWGTQKENLNAPGFVRYCRSRTGDNSPFNKGRKVRQNEDKQEAA